MFVFQQTTVSWYTWTKYDASSLYTLRCTSSFHACCLYEWLKSLPDTRLAFHWFSCVKNCRSGYAWIRMHFSSSLIQIKEWNFFKIKTKIKKCKKIGLSFYFKLLTKFAQALLFFSVLWIRMDPELLPGSGSGIKVPDPAKSERACK